MCPMIMMKMMVVVIVMMIGVLGHKSVDLYTAL